MRHFFNSRGLLSLPRLIRRNGQQADRVNDSAERSPCFARSNLVLVELRSMDGNRSDGRLEPIVPKANLVVFIEKPRGKPARPKGHRAMKKHLWHQMVQGTNGLTIQTDASRALRGSTARIRGIAIQVNKGNEQSW